MGAKSEPGRGVQRVVALVAALTMIAGASWGLWSAAVGSGADDSVRHRGDEGSPSSGGASSEPAASRTGDESASGASASGGDRGSSGPAAARARPRAAPAPQGVAVEAPVVAPPPVPPAATVAVSATANSATPGQAGARRDGSGRRDAPARDRAGAGPPTVATLRITVVAAEDGAPLDRAAVRVLFPGDVPESAFTTSREGVGEVPVVRGTTVEVRAKSPGRVLAIQLATPGAPEFTSVRIELARGVLVRGVVLSESRRPLGGVAVRAFRSAEFAAAAPFGDEPVPVAEASSDRNGRYVLDCLPRSVECVLVAASDGLATEFLPVPASPDVDAQHRRDFEMYSSAEFAGWVEDLDGRPVEGAWVHAVQAPHEEDLAEVAGRLRFSLAEALELLALDELSSSLATPLRARSDAEGKFRLAGAYADVECTLIALHPRLGRSAPTAPAYPGGGPVRAVLRGSRTAEFLVLDARSVPVDRASIVSDLPWERWTVRGSGEGRYGPVVLDVGVSPVAVTPPRGAPGIYVGDVDAGVKDRVVEVIRLRSGEDLEGVVQDDRLRPLAGARVSCGARSVSTDARGAWRIEDAADEDAGDEDTDVTASMAGHTSVTVPRRMARSIQLLRVTQLRLRLILPPGAAPPPWIQVGSRSGDSKTYVPDLWSERTIWDGGRVAVADRPAEHSWVVILAGGFEMLEKAVRILPGESIDLGDVPLVLAGRVSGQVCDPDGRAIPGAHVWTEIASSVRARQLFPTPGTETGTDGSFSIALPSAPEACQILADAPGFGRRSVACDLLPDGTVGTIVLTPEKLFRGRILPPTGQQLDVTVSNSRDRVHVETDVGGWFEVWFPGVPTQVRAGLFGKPVLDLAVEAGTWEPGTVREFEMKR